MQTKLSNESVGGIVVTYNPDPNTLALQLSRLSPQVGRIFIVDNDSTNTNDIAHVASTVTSAEIHFCDRNYGLGKAHNIGIQASRNAGCDAVLLLDQDTIPNKDMVSKLLGSLNKLNLNSQKISAVGSTYIGMSGQLSFFVQFSGFRFQKKYCRKTQCDQIIPADMLISSGSLIPMIAIDTIGNMDETLFIDHVDTEWFLRAKSLGWQAFGICDAVMDHSLGERTLRIWLGRWRNLPVHFPFRYYFIYRNSILLHRRQYADLHWRRADILRLILMACILPFSSNHKWSCFRMIFLGIFHGLQGKSGPMVN